MAFRVSRRVKYIVVLAFITICLYASIGTDSLNSMHLQDHISMEPANPMTDKNQDSNLETILEDKSAFAKKPQQDFEEDIQAAIIPPTSIDSEASPQKDILSPVVPMTTDKPLEDVKDGRPLSNAGVEASLGETAANVVASEPGSRPNLVTPQQAQSKAEAAAKPSAIRESFDLHRIEKFPVKISDMKTLPKKSHAQIPKIQVEDPTLTESAAEKQVRLERQAEIKSTFQRDWAAYRQFAWMHDELRPITNGTNDPFGGWGATLVDALDTLLIMNLREEYEEASKAVARIDFTFTESRQIPLFETTIRYLGGLLSAYDLGVAQGHRDPVMLSQAKLLGKVLYGAFDTPNRLPMLKYDYREQAVTQRIMRAESDGVMSEAGSLSVEFTRLAQLSTGDDQDRIFDAIQRITDAFDDSMEYMSVPGLWPVRLDFSGCKPVSRQVSHPSTAQSRPQLQSDNNGASNPDTVVPTPNTAGSPAISPIKSVPGQAELTKVGQKASVAQLEDAHEVTDELLDILKAKKISTEKDVRVNSIKRQSSAISENQHRPSLPVSQVPEDVCEPQGIRPPPHVSSQTYSQGALADSTYEYFTKEFLLLGGGEEAAQYKRLYELSIEATKKWLLFKPLVPDDLGAHQLLMSGDLETHTEADPRFHAKMQHLTCFIGGMFAMGAKVFNRPEDLKLAAKLTDGCVWAYSNMPTGVAPESFHLHECKDKECKWQDFQDEVDLRKQKHKQQMLAASKESDEPDWAHQDPIDRVSSEASHEIQQTATSTVLTKREPPSVDASNQAAKLSADAFKQSQTEKARVPKPAPPPYDDSLDAPMFWLDDRYILRPEAIESVWYMYRITGDKSWQEKGWKMWQATESVTRTAIAHTAVGNLKDPNHIRRHDSLESFWFAETLKYYYLLFSDFNTISLDEWVLNTEAHPFKRPN